LVIAGTGRLNDAAKVIQDTVVEANRDFGLPWFRGDDRATFGMRKINITTQFSGGLFHSVPFAADCRRLALHAEMKRMISGSR